MVVYTQEQLNEFKKNFTLFSGLSKILKVLAEEPQGINMKDIGERVNLGPYPRDKAILALEFSGFIRKEEIAGAKIFTVTEQGKKLMETTNNK